MALDLKNLSQRLRTFYYLHSSLHHRKRLIRYTLADRPLPMPKYLFVEPTNACNYKCPKCPQAGGLDRAEATLDVDLFRDLVRQLKPYKTSIALHHSGEPFLHPRLFDLIRISREAGLYTMVVTNASMLHKEDFRIAREGPDAMTFSVDGVSPESYAPAHGGASWEKISFNIEEFFRRRDASSPTQCVLMTMVKDSQTPEQIEDCIKFINRFPFFATLMKPAFTWPDGKRVTPIPETPPSHRSYPCGHPWVSPAVLADGSVAPCCLDAHGLYTVGNIREKPFIEIFRGHMMDRLRQHLADLEGTPPLPLCDSCDVKRQSMPFNLRKRILFQTMPLWKLFFSNLPTPIDI